MNDTHGVTGQGWYGFDLDGTLAKYDGWKGIDHIGEPVKPMVDLIKRMHDEGKVVKIMTARVSPRPRPETAKTRYPLYAGDGIGDVPEHAARWMDKMTADGHVSDQVEACSFYRKEEWTACDFIADWCLEHLGFLPEITHQKDHLMLELYDDRVKQVVPNEGWLVEDIAASKRQKVVVDRVEVVNAKWWDRLNWFFIGAMSMVIFLIVLHVGFARVKPLPEATEKLHEAIHEFMESQRQEAR